MTFNLNDFNRFFLDYQQRFIRFAIGYVRDEAVAEDIVIESMMYYWGNKERLSAESDNIPAYILTVVKHKCIDYLRYQKFHQNMSDEISRLHAWEISSRIATLENLEPHEIFTDEIEEIVDKTFAGLTEQSRRIFVMSRYENKSYKEIAELLGISIKGVEFHISKVIRLLRINLKDYLTAFIIFFCLF